MLSHKKQTSNTYIMLHVSPKPSFSCLLDIYQQFINNLTVFRYYKWDPNDKVRYGKNMINSQYVGSRTKVQMEIIQYLSINNYKDAQKLPNLPELVSEPCILLPRRQICCTPYSFKKPVITLVIYLVLHFHYF